MSGTDCAVKVTTLKDGQTKSNVFTYVGLVDEFPEMLPVLVVVDMPGFKKLTLEVGEMVAVFERVEWLSQPIPGVN